MTHPSTTPALEFVDIRGSRLAYRRAGSGPSLVLLHGGVADSREWSRQFVGLADYYDVLAWDAPGFGSSTDPPETFRLRNYADALADLIASLDLGRPHVGGLSFGAGLALELYRRHPLVPRSLVLASAYAGWPGSLPTDQVQRRLASALRMAEQPAEEWLADFMNGLLTASAAPELRQELASILSDTRPATIRTSAHAFAEADLRDALPHIDVPTLLLYGTLDRRSPPEIAEELHRQIPSSTLVFMPEVGHQSNMEAPEQFNDAVRTFLRSVDQEDARK